ncbi:MAG: preprotein translocase subunit SecG [Chlorobiales bacterium]|jgi:preprotein translocase subunit SecG|nr:preprotein translocase subunit SecG [Chlorobiales bacterium]
MHTFIVVLTILIAILLIIAVLLQSSKGSGLAGGFGGLGTVQTLGVRRTADFLSKTTSILAALFMVFCVLAEFTMPSTSNKQEESVIQKNAPQVPGTPSALPLPDGAEQPKK